VVAGRDAAVLEALDRELSKRYGADYQVVVCGELTGVETQIRDLLAAGTPVALVIARPRGLRHRRWQLRRAGRDAPG
jgi:hypothetical protein